MKKVSLATILALSTVAVTGAFAEGGFQGPSVQQPQQQPQQHHYKDDFKRGGFINSNQSVSKASEANSWLDDQYIILQGHIVKQVGKDDFIFKDSTGEIRVEIERKAWRGQNISPNDEVKLYGEVDKSWEKTEVDIDRVEKIVK
ncbi:NirD/YgiW/YdeI family stress tolerance protein [Aggregatibacter kilianii]|uniref:YgiW/YdeI family stress tolerance OB fold protein n=1 Tax=Aggregatibacter kilianii TaxID=2025884 RepID=UPI0028D3ABEF|nr:NirD/YgiW/YdeI family stress tolerance protein [Aggregatibacter kilianii]